MIVGVERRVLVCRICNYNNELGPLSSLLKNKYESTWSGLIMEAGEEAFSRQCMGLRPSPYNIVQMLHTLMPVIYGKSKRKGRVF